MLGRLMSSVAARAVGRRCMGSAASHGPAVEEEYFVVARKFGQLPVPGRTYSVDRSAYMVYLALAGSVLFVASTAREMTTIPVEVEKVSIADPVTGEVRPYFKPVGVVDTAMLKGKIMPGYEVVSMPSPTSRPTRFEGVVASAAAYSAQMDAYARGDTSFIGTRAQLFFPDKAAVLAPMTLPDAALDRAMENK